MQNLPDQLIAKVLRDYSVSADASLCNKIRTYISTLLLWNRKISLTTVTDRAEILKFHFGESFFAASVVPIRDGRLADVGSGAGFPGIPLRMLIPGLELTLIESNSKKCAFLSEVARKLELDHVTVLHSRMEDIPVRPDQFDFITARAVGHHRDLLSWARQHLSGKGKVVLWIGAEDAEQVSHEIGWLWSPPKLIPGSKGRFIVAGSPKD
jgi:16S rRNA (guanine527-N7)-methyltransferase